MGESLFDTAAKPTARRGSCLQTSILYSLPWPSAAICERWISTRLPESVPQFPEQTFLFRAFRRVRSGIASAGLCIQTNIRRANSAFKLLMIGNDGLRVLMERWVGRPFKFPRSLL